MVTSKASSISSLQQVSDIAVPCTCERSKFPPVYLHNHAYFLCWVAKEHQRTNHSISFVEEYIQDYSLLKECCVRTIPKIKNIQRCICSVFVYSNRITLFGGEFQNKTYKVALYQLSDDTTDSVSWQTIPTYSRKTLVNLNPNNCICLQYRDRVIVATIVTSNKYSNKIYIYFHVYFPEAIDEIYWKSAFLQIHHPQKLKNFSCDLQSCVMLSDKVYYSVKFSNNMICMYQSDLATLFDNTDSQQHVLHLLPSNMWPIHDPTISKCFLSVFNDKIICISVKCIDSKTLLEVRFINPSLQQTCFYHFSTDVEVTSAAIVPDTIHNLATVYHDQKMNSCYLKILRIT